MFRKTTARASGLNPNTLLIVVLTSLGLLAAGCATAPSMQDVDVVTDDTRIVYGSVNVFSAKGKLQDWGVGWTGHSYFYVTILPADSTEAITYRLDDDGMFYWALEPGDYSLLGFYWEKDQTRRSGHFGADFSVPETGGDTYLGSIELRSIRTALVPIVKDRFDEMAVRYDVKFPQRKGTSVSDIIEMPGVLGTVAGDDTVLVVTPDGAADSVRQMLERKGAG